MGTWSAEIFGNDSSCEVKEYFYERYNLRDEVSEIASKIEDKFLFSLSIPEDRDNIFFALVSCLWDVGHLSDDHILKVKHIVASKNYIQLYKNLDADSNFINEREKYLNKFITKISTPNLKPVKRKAPPKTIDTVYEAGTCLSFQYDNGRFGGALIIDSAFYKNNGSMCVILTDIYQDLQPTFKNFLSAHLIDFNWEMVYGESMKFAAFDDQTARMFPETLGYDRASMRESFFEYNDRFFMLQGTLPRFTKYLLGTIGVENYYLAPYDKFVSNMQRKMFAKRNESIQNLLSISKQTLKELSSLLIKK